MNNIVRTKYFQKNIVFHDLKIKNSLKFKLMFNIIYKKKNKELQ